MVDEKLPTLFSPSATVSFAARSTLSRATLFTTLLPSLGTTKVESPRPPPSSRLYAKRHSSVYSRHPLETIVTDQSSSSSAWWAANTENKRYASIATMKVQALEEKFNEQLKSYNAFHPVVVDGGAYSTQAIQRRFNGESVSDSLSKLTDFAATRSVRSTFDDSFVSTMEKISGVQGNFTPRTVERKRAAVITPDGLELSSSSLSLHSDKFTAGIELWLRENKASEEELRQKRLFYDSQRAKSEQRERSQYRQKWQAKLDALHDERLDAFAHSKHSNVLSKRVSIVENLTAATEQRILWSKFLSSEANAESAGSPRTKFTSTWTSNKSASNNELHEWIEGKWHNSTHRHEEAALKIQCAYRCFCAKEEVARRRYARRMVFAGVLSREKEAEAKWENALRMRVSSYDTGGNTMNRLNPSIKLLKEKLLAVVVRRRNAKAQEERYRREIEEYAATSIQRVYRGYLGRFWVKLMRNGDPVEQLRLIRIGRVVVCLQARWRGCLARAAIERQRAAVLVLQRLVRSRAAFLDLCRKRRERRMEVEYGIHKHYIKVIIRFLKRCVNDRKEYMKERWDQLFLIQRIGRGRIGRGIVEKSYKRRCAAQLVVALAIQRRYRGWRGRVKAQYEREQRAEKYLQLCRTDAVQVIERSWRFARGYYIEKSRKARKEAERIARILRRQRREKLNLRRMRIAALKIQYWYFNARYVREVRMKRIEQRRELVRSESAERILRFYREYKFRANRQSPVETAPAAEEEN
ncbi:IQ calmodulin-binding motif containing protein, putative [Trypanosoma equiperdum]|uniref:IQ calmodulin-binding protein n=2 Tax=Trypanozoon TaxID=39700 RepID=Q57ZU4_TRYB2|nr:hypothetical protein, conserved [Trypanosoma brucei brucei TREU927]AAX79380.1 hypothetical protein, conserved [Trypanosoma brucei]AAZ11381.1 hypothetical protein, conserved [Trypanosoma brucei brucei TREU927]SCU64727.1 IQ calmodulin-binding motif containing protein, putative [Trypanosoma equiperdum]